jgi:ABC-type transport system substrate-binding protein
MMWMRRPCRAFRVYKIGHRRPKPHLNAFKGIQYAGTGPYKLAQHAPGQRIVYEAYPGYWGAKPKSRRVITSFYADSAALAAAVESGQVDLGYRSFSPEDIKRLSKNDKLQVVRSAQFPSVRYIAFNVPTRLWLAGSPRIHSR